MKNIIFNASIIGGIQYVILTVIAMMIYPGSTRRNLDTTGYLFSENFLSDLGRTIVFDGTENYYSAGIYLFALSFIGLSTLLLFTALPKVLMNNESNNLWTKILVGLMLIIGTLSGLSFMGIAVTPSNLYHRAHMFFVNFGFKSLLAALLLLMICIYRAKHFPNLYANVLLSSILLLGIYVLLITIGPNPYHSDQGLMIQVIGQKIIVYVLIISLSIQAFGAKKVWNRITA